MTLDGGIPYSVRVFAQPAGQLCTVAGAAGTIGVADVDDLQGSRPSSDLLVV